MQETPLPGLGSPLFETIEIILNKLHSTDTRHRCHPFFFFFFEITSGRDHNTQSKFNNISSSSSLKDLLKNTKISNKTLCDVSKDFF